MQALPLQAIRPGDASGHSGPTSRSARPAEDVAEVESRELLQGARELLIRHGGVQYRLRHTRNDKLILTK